MNDVAAKLALPARWLLVMAIAYTLTMSGFYFVAPPATGPVTQVTRETAAARPAADLNDILAANLFGTADAAAEAGPVDEPAVVTRLPLDLLGVFVADHPENSVAIISQRGRQGLRYSVGEEVPGDATLLEVHPDHVVLRRAGSRETLHFPQPGESLAARTTQPAGTGMDDTFPAMMEAVPDDMPPGFEDPLGHGSEPDYDMNMEDPSVEDLVNEYRQELEQDPTQALEELGVEPVTEGAAEGYRVGDLAHSPYLSQTGLQPGDVILSVNGRPVGDLSADRAELANVLAEGSARLEVQRGSRRFFVTASLQ